jgi:SAM-dependent methyltransferase
MSEITLHPTGCALCGTGAAATEIYPSNFDLDAFNPQTFSARRLPDRVHYRMVRCDACGLVRSDPVADLQTLVQLYARSTFDYGTEVDGLKRTYGSYLARLDKVLANKGSLLEIGCGNGFFLEEAIERGFKNVRGVEPSAEAVSKARPGVRDSIVCDIMRPGLFDPESFDVICMFQVFDHISDPGPLLDECFCILKPGGFVLILNHNIQALSARVLGERSPIIDIEHTYLYGPRTLSRLVQAHRFVVHDFGAVWNHYTLRYLVRLIPICESIKQRLLKVLSNSMLGRIPLLLPLGNLYLVARKPESKSEL